MKWFLELNLIGRWRWIVFFSFQLFTKFKMIRTQLVRQFNRKYSRTAFKNGHFKATNLLEFVIYLVSFPLWHIEYLYGFSNEENVKTSIYQRLELTTENRRCLVRDFDSRQLFKRFGVKIQIKIQSKRYV